MYELILLDYSMPGMDGPQFCRKLIQILNDYNLPLPFICCCTAYAEASFKTNALASGMDYFVTKPVSDDELNGILKCMDKAEDKYDGCLNQNYD